MFTCKYKCSPLVGIRPVQSTSVRHLSLESGTHSVRKYAEIPKGEEVPQDGHVPVVYVQEPRELARSLLWPPDISDFHVHAQKGIIQEESCLSNQSVPHGGSKTLTQKNWAYSQLPHRCCGSFFCTNASVIYPKILESCKPTSSEMQQ